MVLTTRTTRTLRVKVCINVTLPEKKDNIGSRCPRCRPGTSNLFRTLPRGEWTGCLVFRIRRKAYQTLAAKDLTVKEENLGKVVNFRGRKKKKEQEIPIDQTTEDED